MGSMLGQRRKTLSCPDGPNLHGNRALVTGGASGVGEYISRGLVDQIKGRPFDCIVLNAGINSTRYAVTAEGMERTFAVNVFGHHLLFRGLQRRGLLAPNARVVITTGDVYMLANDCTSDFRFSRGPMAYARSKLGNIWQMREINRLYPDFHAVVVHPGVVASGFAGAKTGPFG